MSRLMQGIDIVDIRKFRKVMERHPSFVDEIFTKSERDYCLAKMDPAPHLAARFAAKESYLKAIGAGFSAEGIDSIFGQIEVVHEKSGKPAISLSGWAAKNASRRRIAQTTLSLSHAADYAMASVVLVIEAEAEHLSNTMN